MGKFVRSFDQDMIIKIKETKLFSDFLKPDILNGKVFPAIRNNSIQFYYKGGLLFKYDKNGFQTHYKYLINNDWLENNKYIINNDGEEIKENNLIIKNFVEGYDSIKKTLDKYAKPEATLTSEFYKKSIFKKDVKGDNLLIDIEAAFEKQAEEVDECDVPVTGEKSRVGTDRIDVVFLDKKAKRVIFCEVKRFDDERIYSKNSKEAEVIGQLKRYKQQIDNKERSKEMVVAYKSALRVYTQLFDIPSFEVEDIYEQAVLFVTGCPKILYDGKTKEAVKKIQKEGFKVHFRDKASGTALNEIVKICKE